MRRIGEQSTGEVEDCAMGCWQPDDVWEAEYKRPRKKRLASSPNDRFRSELHRSVVGYRECVRCLTDRCHTVVAIDCRCGGKMQNSPASRAHDLKHRESGQKGRMQID